MKPGTSGSIFPTPRSKGQIPYSPGTEDSKMPRDCPGGKLKFRFDHPVFGREFQGGGIGRMEQLRTPGTHTSMRDAEAQCHNGGRY